MPQAPQGPARFGSFELDLRVGELHHNGQATILQEQQLKVLLMLVERDGEIATRDEIRERLWPNDTVVEFDHGINQAIKNLRRLLGDSAQNPQYIETIARRGYRLMAPVEWQSPAAVPAPLLDDAALVRRRCEGAGGAVASREHSDHPEYLYPGGFGCDAGSQQQSRAYGSAGRRASKKAAFGGLSLIGS